MKPPNDIDLQEAKENLEQGYDASDPSVVNTARKKASRKKNERLKVIQAVMEQKECRKWLREYLDSLFLFSNPVVSGDPYLTHFNIGKQDAGKQLMADIMNAAPDLYLLMIREKNEEE